jgi:hypothetical protein
MGLGYIQSRRGVTALEPEEGQTNLVGQIYPTLGQLPQFWNPMKISNLAGYIRPDRYVCK